MQQHTTTTTHHIQSKTIVSKRQNDTKFVDTRMTNGPAIATGVEGILNEQHLGFKFKISSVWSFLDFDASQKLSRRFHATTQIGTNVYLFGGECKIKQPNNTEPLKKVLDDLLCFNIVTCEWTMLDPGNSGGPQPRKGATMVAHKDSLYVYGGAAPTGCFADLWEWKVRESRWVNLTLPVIERFVNTSSDSVMHPKAKVKLLTALRDPKKKVNELARLVASDYPGDYPQARAYHVCVVNQDDIIVYGGYGFTRESSALWKFSIPTHTWHNIPLQGIRHLSERQPHPGLRFGLVGCVHKNNLFIFGGQQGSKLAAPVLWRLDLQTYEWQQLATTGSAPAPRTYATSCLVGSRWFIHGGSSADDVFADSHEFNLDLLHWHPSASLFSDVSLEGHTSVAVLSPWSVTTVLLIGGATSGPGVPAGPVMKADFLLPSPEELEHSENIRLEDYAIRPLGAATLLWKLAREAKPYSNETAEIVDKCEQMQAVRDAAEQRIAELVSRYEDVRLQHGELDERYRLQESKLHAMETTIREETAITGLLRKENERLREELAKATAELATRRKDTVTPLSSVDMETETETKEIIYIREEIITQTRRLVQIQNEVSQHVISKLQTLSQSLSEEPLGDLRHKMEHVSRAAENICASLKETATRLAHNVGAETVLEKTPAEPSPSPPEPSLEKKGSGHIVMKKTTTKSTKKETSTLTKKDIEKTSANETAPGSRKSTLKEDEKTAMESEVSASPLVSPSVPGVSRGVAAGPRSGLLDLGGGKRKASNSRTSKKAVDAATSVKPVSVKGLDVALQCGNGILRLKAPSPSKAKQSVH
eukprot:Gregarina_sp_Poly_1__170@NODE_103_length_14370_cov_80_074250_g90_i0_p2_GENE_NODE_103_length_14370_cov_80_074250_g90_i0NODE_103_length_14370_cov_80_074250_g90_i0_p2_ORF_typecomplete_len820_score158_99Kelch_4/PF13418_6/1_5e08Kelch_4/PF13418_6/2_1e06Kelch_4/PF13418_6/4_3e06Kelch_4/PF13418_6/4_4e05Kelch_4/PF13418_6/0_00018Kelch_4/PF13418_6/22Kelch_6/PF13964_6/2_9e07Kelch_6/PF13964_6/8_4e05Kelch_6/PF13964_6/8_3e07Kelch_6/PF13964_6/4_6e06Kelch_6/PF13964_6/2_6Kelch_3/PF13415_6/3e07Kelch_3/PF13415_6/0_0